MHKNDLVGIISRTTGFPQKDADLFITTFINAIKGALKDGDKVTLVDFGTFSVSDTKEKIGRNPQTGEEIKIAASKRVKFKAGKKLKEEVKSSCDCCNKRNCKKK